MSSLLDEPWPDPSVIDAEPDLDEILIYEICRDCGESEGRHTEECRG